MSSRAPRRRPRRPSPVVVFGIIAILLWAVLFGAVWLGWRLHAYLAWLAAWGAVAFAFFGFDKYRAQREGFRIPERVLLGLMLVGGFVGAGAGMLVWRHKTLHARFWIVLIASAILHAAVAYRLFH